MNSARHFDLDPSRQARPWLLSVVVPACNAAGSLRTTLERLLTLPGEPPHEIVVVENGSTDDTWELLEQIQKDWASPTRLITLSSERGIGAAYRAGVAVTSGDRLLLTADDLPFGSSDIEAVLACRTLPQFAIGSKAHPRSRVPRSLTRRAATEFFRVARRLMLGLKVGDTQGTFVIEGDLARRLVSSTSVSGFGMTTELVALAARYGTEPVELPVVLEEQPSPTRIRYWVDGAEMLVSLAQLRRRLGPARRPRVVILPTDARTTT
jgi:glycosyltransferase involved in cell wall biosynthesis